MDCRKFDASRSAGGSFPDFTSYHGTAAKSPGKGVVTSDAALCVGEGGRSGVCVCHICSTRSVPRPKRVPWEHDRPSVLASAPRSVRSSVPPFLCTTRRLIGNNVTGTSSSAATDLGQDADRKIRKASSRNSLTPKVQLSAAGIIKIMFNFD